MSDDRRQGLVSSEDLLAIAEQAGMTPRALEAARAQRLLPKAVERGPNRGVHPTWLYPSGTDTQLRRLIQWREHTVEPRLLRILLWVDGFPIDLADVKAGVVEGISEMRAELRRGAAALGVDSVENPEQERESLKRIGQALARKKDKTVPFPRRPGVSNQERQDAFTAMAMMALSQFGQVPSEEQAAALEKVTQIDKLREPVLGQAPLLTGSPLEIFGNSEATNLALIQQTAEALTDSELSAARPLIRALFIDLPVTASMLIAVTGDSNPAGIGLLRDLAMNPAILFLFIPIAARKFKDGPQAELEQWATQIHDTADLSRQVEPILEMPQDAVDANLARHPEEAERARRMIDMEIEGAFAAAPDRKPARRPPRRRA